MKDRAPAFQFYPRQFAGDDRVMGMDLEAIGAHILLMCTAAASPERCRIDAGSMPTSMPFACGSAIHPMNRGKGSRNSCWPAHGRLATIVNGGSRVA